MDIRKLQRAIVDGLEDVKAQNIVVFNTEHLSALFERVIIASGTSNRQTKALASGVRDSVREAGYPAPRMEGESNGEWIIVDCGAAVVHVMQPSIREYYHLEEIWGDKPVKLKLGNASGGLVKASEPEREAPARRAGAKKAAAPARSTGRLSPAKKAALAEAAPRSPARKTASRGGAAAGSAKSFAQPAAKPPAKSPARKTPARKAPVTAKAMVTRVVGVKRAAAKAPVARKTGAVAAPVRKTSAAGTPARKTTPARKAPVRKAPSKA